MPAPSLSRLVLAAILMALACSLSILADSKTEIDLRGKLAVSESARATALKDKAALSATVDRLTKAQAKSSAAISTASEDAAVSNAQRDETAQLIQQAAVNAQAAAIIAQAQAKGFNSNTVAMMIIQAVVLLSLLLGFANSWLVSNRDHRWAMAAAKETREALAATHDTIAKLEHNTDGIRDALVKTTAEKSYAEGVKDEKERE